MNAKTFHRKPDGSTVVKENGKIVTNLPGTAARTAPTAGGPVPSRAGSDAASAPSYLAAYDAFQATTTPTVDWTAVDAPFAEPLADLDARLAELRQLDEDAVVPVSALGDLHAGYPFSQDDELPRKEAIDVLRLERALLREQRTEARRAADMAAGVHRLSDYGNGPLGTSRAEGFHEPNSREWLLARTRGLGGSDKIGTVNENGDFVPFDADGKYAYLTKILAAKSPAAVAALQAAPEEAPDELTQALPLRIGNHMERTVQYEFAVEHPEYRHLEDKSTRTAEGVRTYHRFNPDGVLQDVKSGEYGIFEAKTSRDAATFEKAVPGYLAQCLHNAAAANLSFAVLVADVDGEDRQRVIRVDYTPAQLQHYRDAVDRVWLLHKPRFDRKPVPVVEA